MEKNAWIRSDRSEGEGRCPFGLPIAKGCKHAGNSVAHMCPLSFVSENRVNDVKKANGRVYIHYKNNERCIYAAEVMDKQDVVNCNFGDTSGSIKTPVFSGSPLYPNVFGGYSINGLYAFPLGFYGDNDSSRNLFLGLFSIVGNSGIDEFLKYGNIEENLEKVLSGEIILSVRARK